MKDHIKEQAEKLASGNPTIALKDSCRIGYGIQRIEEKEFETAVQRFIQERDKSEITFFIPASGSGSRMFSKIYESIRQNEPNDFLNEVIENITKFAFYPNLSPAWKAQIQSGTVDKIAFATYLLSPEGLNLGQLPKGLIPFHFYKDQIRIPFQEHLIQGSQLATKDAHFHFTVNPLFKEAIDQELKPVAAERKLTYTFSVQDPASNSIAFDAKLNPLKDKKGEVVTRPAGHGALIKNLDQIDADLVFIRNIDNVQHEQKAGTSIQSRQALGGLLLQFQEEAFNVLSKIERGHAFESSLKTLNEKYDLRLSELELGRSHHAFEALNRPIRLCGMVKNEGAPGGGPFWVVNEKGNHRRQIAEKSQISADPGQLLLLESATHFNPVELVCGLRNYEGKKFNLLEFVNQKQYFIVEKTQEGQQIKYIEQPGLWNGAMAHWLTLFYEIDSACFSPVKTILDLLKDPHQGDYRG
ncbi:MAG: DUF4301 family protein [Crocinitomicaceae bacterium]